MKWHRFHIGFIHKEKNVIYCFIYKGIITFAETLQQIKEGLGMEETFETTFKNLFRKYYSGLLFYAERIVGDEEAEDIVQDVFAELWRRRNDIQIGDQIQSFLYRSVYTKALNCLKHRAIVENHNAEEEAFYQKRLEFYQPDHSDIIRRIEDRELHHAIHNAINELPDKCKEVFKLSYLHNMKNKEIAEIMNISLRTVEAHMYKALKFLRSRLGHLSL